MYRRVELTNYNRDLSEAAYDHWCAHVIAVLSRRCGFEIEVEQHAYSDAGDDTIDAVSPDDRMLIRQVLEDLWDEWPRSAA